ncbi:nuclear inhibitor of protein phosphatase [Spatholobus suberectus]|nr:nuclear inhibitor of protein phosphatase [Spatholobus suberectus]
MRSSSGGADLGTSSPVHGFVSRVHNVMSSSSGSTDLGTFPVHKDNAMRSGNASGADLGTSSSKVAGHSSAWPPQSQASAHQSQHQQQHASQKTAGVEAASLLGQNQQATQVGGSIYVIDLGSARGRFDANERLTKDSPVELEVEQSEVNLLLPCVAPSLLSSTNTPWVSEIVGSFDMADITADAISFSWAVDSAIRSRTPSNFGASPVHSFASVVDVAIRSSSASEADLGTSRVHSFASAVDNAMTNSRARGADSGTSSVHGFASTVVMRTVAANATTRKLLRVYNVNPCDGRVTMWGRMQK